MKIAFCLYKFFPYGGLQRDFLHIAKECLKRNYRVLVYTMSWDGEIPDGIEFIKVPKKGLTNHTQNKKYAEWVYNDLLSQNVDCVFGFNKMPNLDIYYAADVCFAAKKRSILTKLLPRYKHYIQFEKAVFSPESRTRLLMLTENQIINFKYFYHTQKERFILLPPGITLDRKWSKQSDELKEIFKSKNKLAQNQKIIVQIGSDYYRKGVDRSLIAIASLPEGIKKNIVYYVIGRDKIGKFKALAEKLNIQDQVHFLGARDDINLFLAAADLLLHPARQEAAGIVLIEAIVAGVPLIATDVCGYAPYIKKAHCGNVLVSPFSQIKFNLELNKVLINSASLEKMKKNAISFSNNNDLYSLPSRVVDYIEEYVNDKI
ncbi:glycosyltransferase family 4 protein [Providencia manganoxydans]|uniref:glycosyltransferase family 4 protein n=1 Tax=Providencia TaxID=586 RepID=UPI0029BFDE12|nr:glycosyltransferase family 4 protein [Providencia manganoxydans]MDX4946864.1 glycosyltransferase family 4 protein [Providencia manganoxydans]